MDGRASTLYTAAMARADHLDGLLGYHLRRASSLLMSDLAARLAKLGLRPTEASVLVVLASTPMATQSEIGRRLSIKRANMAPLVAGLVARGLVDRGTPVGRAHPLILTATGVELASAVEGVMAEHDGDHFGLMLPAERDRLRTVLIGLWRGSAASG